MSKAQINEYRKIVLILLIVTCSSILSTIRKTETDDAIVYSNQSFIVLYDKKTGAYYAERWTHKEELDGAESWFLLLKEDYDEQERQKLAEWEEEGHVKGV